MHWEQVSDHEWRLVVRQSKWSFKARIMRGSTRQRRRNKRTWEKNGRKNQGKCWAWFVEENLPVDQAWNLHRLCTFHSLDKAMRAMEAMARLDG